MRAVRPELASGAQSHLSRYAGDIQPTSRSVLAQLVAFPAAAQSWHEIPRWPADPLGCARYDKEFQANIISMFT